MYKMDVSENAGGGYWCIKELSFYDADGNRVATQSGMASAETESAVQTRSFYGMAWHSQSAYAAGMAFNDDHGASFYCSQNGVSTGWLQYQFESGTAPIGSYRVERLNGAQNLKYSPDSWQMQQSLDGGLTWTVIDEQSGHSTWSEGEIKSFTVEAPSD